MIWVVYTLLVAIVLVAVCVSSYRLGRQNALIDSSDACERLRKLRVSELRFEEALGCQECQLAIRELVRARRPR